MTAAFISTELHMSGTKWPIQVLEIVHNIYTTCILTFLDECNGLFKMPVA